MCKSEMAFALFDLLSSSFDGAYFFINAIMNHLSISDLKRQHRLGEYMQNEADCALLNLVSPFRYLFVL